MRRDAAIVRWTLLLAGALLIWSFMFQVGPAVRDRVPPFRDYAVHVRELGFNAGAIYYTDVDLVPRANLSSRSTFEHTPRGPAAR